MGTVWDLLLIARPQDVAGEAQYSTLNGIGFIRGDTELHQWYLLVNEACVASNISIDEIVRKYLTIMLWRFMRRVELFEQLAAFDIYKYVFGKMRIDEALKQDVADIALQYSALFPGRSNYRHEPRTLEYVANLGIILYRELAADSGGKDDFFSLAYRSMVGSFGRAIMVLRAAYSNFAPRKELPGETVPAEASAFLRRTEMIRVAPTLQQFGLMYLKQSGGHEHPATN